MCTFHSIPMTANTACGLGDKACSSAEEPSAVLMALKPILCMILPRFFAIPDSAHGPHWRLYPCLPFARSWRHRLSRHEFAAP